MKTVTDYSGMTQKKFWELVAQKTTESHALVIKIWDEIQKGIPVSQEDAIACLDALFIDSHARIREHSKALAKYYPTKQYTKNKLKKLKHVWWVDHFTAGISATSTLNWFSAKQHKNKKGKVKYNGASTHFILPHHQLPFYIIPLQHKAWHEPVRNNDSWAIEVVNAGGVRLFRDQWCYWPSAYKDPDTGKRVPYSKPLPENLVKELPPVRLDSPFRGHSVMQPFTVDQVVNCITLKRIVKIATDACLAPERMSQHQDWRKGKSDMGPLWPYVEVNEAAFDTLPIQEYGFIQHYEHLLAAEGTVCDITDIEEEEDNPEYGVKMPTHDDDKDDAKDSVLGPRELQIALVSLGYTVEVDSVFGRKTRNAVKMFQNSWNKHNPETTISVDGIPGPITCQKIQQTQKGA